MEGRAKGTHERRVAAKMMHQHLERRAAEDIGENSATRLRRLADAETETDIRAKSGEACAAALAAAAAVLADVGADLDAIVTHFVATITASEVLVAVDRLILDSTSARSLREKHGDDEAALKDAIAAIIKDRGKMHNPVTQSGGVLLGTVTEVGPESPLKLKPGDRIQFKLVGYMTGEMGLDVRPAEG